MRTLLYFQSICFHLFAIFLVTIFCSGCCSAAVFDVKVPKVLGRLVFWQRTQQHTHTQSQPQAGTSSHLKPAAAGGSKLRLNL